jgi:hypothetical protein
MKLAAMPSCLGGEDYGINICVDQTNLLTAS